MFGRKKAIKQDYKVSHYKMYKSGKFWVFAGALIFGMASAPIIGQAVDVLPSVQTVQAAAVDLYNKDFVQLLKDNGTTGATSTVANIKVSGTKLDVADGKPNVLYLDYTQEITITISNVYTVVDKFGHDSTVNNVTDAQLIEAGKTTASGLKRGSAVNNISTLGIGVASSPTANWKTGVTYAGEVNTGNQKVSIGGSEVKTKYDASTSTFTVTISAAQVKKTFENAGGILVLNIGAKLSRVRIGDIEIPDSKGHVGDGEVVTVGDSSVAVTRKYVDEDGNTVQTDPSVDVEGSDKPDLTPSDVPAGYTVIPEKTKLESGDKSQDTILGAAITSKTTTFDAINSNLAKMGSTWSTLIASGKATITYTVKKSAVTKTPKDPGDNDFTNKEALTKTVTEIADYGSPVSKDNQVLDTKTLYRTVTYDPSADLTNAATYTYSDWTTNDDGVSTSADDKVVSFGAIDELTPEGYTATTTTSGSDDDTVKSGAAQVTPTADDTDQQVKRTVTYTGKPIKNGVTVKHVVVDENGAPVKDANGDDTAVPGASDYTEDTTVGGSYTVDLTDKRNAIDGYDYFGSDQGTKSNEDVTIDFASATPATIVLYYIAQTQTVAFAYTVTRKDKDGNTIDTVTLDPQDAGLPAGPGDLKSEWSHLTTGQVLTLSADDFALDNTLYTYDSANPAAYTVTSGDQTITISLVQTESVATIQYVDDDNNGKEVQANTTKGLIGSVQTLAVNNYDTDKYELAPGQDANVKVTYDADPITVVVHLVEKAVATTIQYVDDDKNGAEVSSTTKQGKVGTEEAYTADEFDGTKYELADGQDSNLQIPFSTAGETVKIHLVHKHTIKGVDESGITATYTLQYLEEGTKKALKDPYKTTIRYTTDTDEATGETTYTPDSSDANIVLLVGAEDVFPGGDYKLSDQQSTPFLSDDLTEYIPIISAVPDEPGNMTDYVYYKRNKFTPENPGTEKGTTEADLHHTVTYNYTFGKESTATAPAQKTYDFYRTATIDDNGDVTYSAWSTDPSGEGGDTSVDTVPLTDDQLGTPAGYKVAITTTITDLEGGVTDVDNATPQPFDGDDARVDVIVAYTASEQTVTYTYKTRVTDSEGNLHEQTIDVTGLGLPTGIDIPVTTGQVINNLTVPSIKGYTPDSTNPTSYTVTGEDNQTITFWYSKATIKADDPNHLVVHHYLEGTTTDVPGMSDAYYGGTVGDAWTVDLTSEDNEAPVGYEMVTTTAPTGTFDATDASEATIYYKASEFSVKYRYAQLVMDADGNPTFEEIDADANNLPTGVSGLHMGDVVDFDNIPDELGDAERIEDSPNYQVSEHSTGVVWFKYVDEALINKRVTRNIHFQYEDGSEAAPTLNQATEYTRHFSVQVVDTDGSLDINGDGWPTLIFTSDFVAVDPTLPAATAETIDGYTADKPHIDAKKLATTYTPDYSSSTFGLPTIDDIVVTYYPQTVTVTPETPKQGELPPGNPDDPIDPKNPDSPKYPAGVTEDDLVQTVKDTVTYVNGDATTTPVEVSVTYKRTATITYDATTGEGTVTYSNWITDAKANDVVSPIIDGKIADKLLVHFDVTNDVADLPTAQTVTVTYYASTVTVTPNIVGRGQIPPGVSGDPIDTTNPESPKYPDDVTKDDLVKTVKDTVTYVNGDDTTTPKTIDVLYTRLAKITYDSKTGDAQVTYGVWGTGTTVNDVVSPTISGKFADKPSVHFHVENNVVDLPSDQNVTVTYYPTVATVTTKTPEEGELPPGNPNEPIDPTNPDSPKYPTGVNNVALHKTVTETVHFKDDEGNELAKPVVTSIALVRTATIDWTDVDNPVVTYGAWKNVDGGAIKFDSVTAAVVDDYTPLKAETGEITSDGGADLDLVIYYTTTKETVPPTAPHKEGDPKDPDNPDGPKWPAGVTNADLNQTAERIIHYVDRDGQKVADDVVQQVKLTRIATVDFSNPDKPVVTYSAWTVEGDFDAVDSPIINGYTTDTLTVDALTVDEPGVTEVTVVYSHPVLPSTEGEVTPPTGGNGERTTTKTPTTKTSTPTATTQRATATTTDGHHKLPDTGGQLPQTGNGTDTEASKLGVLALGLVGIMNILGLAKKRRKDEE